MKQMREKINRRGFNLVELMVVVLVSAIVLLGAAQGFRKLTRSFGLLKTKVDEASEVAFGSEVIVRDFQTLGASFNLVKESDDCNRPFFRYEEDASCIATSETFENQEVSMSCGTNLCARVKTLRPEGSPSEKSSIAFIAEDFSKRAQEVNFTPASLFKMPFIDGGALEMNSAQPKAMVDAVSESLRQESFWKDNRLMLVQTVGPMKTEGVANAVLKKVSYLGRMEKNGTLAALSDSISGAVDLSHSGVAGIPTSFQDYLFKLPLEASREPLLTAKRVQLVRYFLQATEMKTLENGKQVQGANLVRQSWDPLNGIFVSGVVLSTDVQGVRFIRSSTGSETIKFKLKSVHDTEQKLVTDAGR